MKKITTLLAIGAAAIGIQSASAALITLQTNYDATFDDGLTPPYVGNATLTYTAPSALADGVYGWDSLSGLTFSAYFPNQGVTFTNANLQNPTSEVSVVIVGSEFFFASPIGYSINFFNGNSGNFILASEPIFSSTLTSGFRGTTFTYPLYQFVDNPIEIYTGTYGANRQDATVSGGGDPAAVPEPGQVAALLLLLAGIGGYVFAQRRKTAKSVTTPAAA